MWIDLCKENVEILDGDASWKTGKEQYNNKIRFREAGCVD
jgi:hypothetical protein